MRAGGGLTAARWAAAGAIYFVLFGANWCQNLAIFYPRIFDPPISVVAQASPKEVMQIAQIRQIRQIRQKRKQQKKKETKSRVPPDRSGGYCRFGLRVSGPTRHRVRSFGARAVRNTAESPECHIQKEKEPRAALNRGVAPAAALATASLALRATLSAVLLRAANETPLNCRNAATWARFSPALAAKQRALPSGNNSARSLGARGFRNTAESPECHKKKKNRARRPTAASRPPPLWLSPRWPCAPL
jgi:hypothetical protein